MKSIYRVSVGSSISIGTNSLFGKEKYYFSFDLCNGLEDVTGFGNKDFRMEPKCKYVIGNFKLVDQNWHAITNNSGAKEM